MYNISVSNWPTSSIKNKDVINKYLFIPQLYSTIMLLKCTGLKISKFSHMFFWIILFFVSDLPPCICYTYTLVLQLLDFTTLHNLYIHSCTITGWTYYPTYVLYTLSRGSPIRAIFTSSITGPSPLTSSFPV